MYFYNGFKAAHQKNVRWLHDNRNFFYPNIYIDRSMEGQLTWAKRSWPFLSHDDCVHIAKENAKVRNNGKGFMETVMKTWLFDEKVFYMFLLLILVDRSLEFSKVPEVKRGFAKLRNEIVAEMWKYHEENGNDALERSLAANQLLNFVKVSIFRFQDLTN
ncbi:hypothetical protein L596_025099 [Steinernema carpocapsae]|uniref:Uncharacterized protein n=1 Tax=Steinernema carpocapsae TaxID=34508 RepID=A0A4U5M7M5_STECR|nr:hypothetical protein L596_025099 [Steinernema carpocapsae]